jgi:hypothetical protein
MNMRHAALLAILVTVGLVAGACGSDEALTKAEYIEQGNAICANNNAPIDLLFEEVFSDFPLDPTQQQLVEANVEITAGINLIIEAELVDLRELAAPKEDEDTLELLWDDLEAVLVETNQLAEDAAAGDQAAIDRIDSEEDPFADVNRRANQYGLTVCAEQ